MLEYNEGGEPWSIHSCGRVPRLGGGQEMGVESNSKRNIDVKLRSLVSVPWMALCDTPGILSREMKQELFGREAVLVFLGKVE